MNKNDILNSISLLQKHLDTQINAGLNHSLKNHQLNQKLYNVLNHIKSNFEYFKENPSVESNVLPHIRSLYYNR